MEANQTVGSQVSCKIESCALRDLIELFKLRGLSNGGAGKTLWRISEYPNRLGAIKYMCVVASASLSGETET
jgi:hypothetical protein